MAHAIRFVVLFAVAPKQPLMLRLSMANVTFIVVTRNSASSLEHTLRSIQQQTWSDGYIQTVVVDNDSSDDTLAIAQDFSWVKTLPQRANNGFAAGNNVAIHHAPADYYMLVNPDVILHQNWLLKMMEALEADLTVGIAGSKIFYSNRLLLQHAGAIVSDNGLTSHRGARELDIGQYDTLTDVQYVTGAALATRDIVARRLNFLPEAYFLYFEEVEYCLNARKAGWRVAYV